MDTDSIISDIELDKKYIDQYELGKLKLESIIKKGYFFCSKMYYIIKDNNKSEFKAKGIKLNDFNIKNI